MCIILTDTRIIILIKEDLRMIFQESFGDFFRRLRRAKGFKSQKALAEASGVSQATISRIEDGTQMPQPDTLKLFAKALDVPYSDLMVLAGHWDEEDALEPIAQLKESLIKGPVKSTNEQEFLRKLEVELSDEKLLEEFVLKLDDQPLTEKEAKAVIAFLRSLRQFEQNQ